MFMLSGLHDEHRSLLHRENGCQPFLLSIPERMQNKTKAKTTTKLLKRKNNMTLVELSVETPNGRQKDNI
jgi:hypothetical protein